MKLFTSENIRNIESTDINSDRISGLCLMDRAATAFVRWISDKINKKSTVKVICGSGNNGADGLVIAKKLHAKGFYVLIYIKKNINTKSDEYEHHLDVIRGIPIQDHDDLSLEQTDTIIDAIFGNGLNRPVTGAYEDLIDQINASEATVYAVDIPSGLSADRGVIGPAIRAAGTFSFQFPKLSFFYGDSSEYVGAWSYDTIGLSKILVANCPTPHHMINTQMLTSSYRERKPHTHKGTYGKIYVVGGLQGMAGAIIMTALAALRSGVGICHVVSATDHRPILQGNIPEAIYHDIEGYIPDEDHTIAIGPGLSTGDRAVKTLSDILAIAKSPIIVDADALNILSMHDQLKETLPKNSILTPHPKEFDRLFGPSGSSHERIEKQRQMSQKYQVIIVQKGHHTSITAPDGRVFFNNTGNAGLATGGSGDVLTGIIAGLFAQGYSPIDAAILGVYLHGLAADLYVQHRAMETLLPTDVIDYLGLAIKTIA